MLKKPVLAVIDSCSTGYYVVSSSSLSGWLHLYPLAACKVTCLYPSLFVAEQTPSLIPPHLLERILNTLQQQYSISPQAEISMEADPGTFDLARLQQYKALGVSRLSMGVQCFNQVRCARYQLVNPACKQDHTGHEHLKTKVCQVISGCHVMMHSISEPAVGQQRSGRLRTD